MLTRRDSVKSDSDTIFGLDKRPLTQAFLGFALGHIVSDTHFCRLDVKTTI